jgi:hypothetical protein
MIARCTVQYSRHGPRTRLRAPNLEPPAHHLIAVRRARGSNSIALQRDERAVGPARQQDRIGRFRRRAPSLRDRVIHEDRCRLATRSREVMRHDHDGGPDLGHLAGIHGITEQRLRDRGGNVPFRRCEVVPAKTDPSLRARHDRGRVMLTGVDERPAVAFGSRDQEMVSRHRTTEMRERGAGRRGQWRPATSRQVDDRAVTEDPERRLLDLHPAEHHSPPAVEREHDRLVTPRDECGRCEHRPLPDGNNAAATGHRSRCRSCRTGRAGTRCEQQPAGKQRAPARQARSDSQRTGTCA